MANEIERTEVRTIVSSGFKITLECFPPLRENQPTVIIKFQKEKDGTPITLTSTNRYVVETLKNVTRRMRKENLVASVMERVTGEEGDELFLLLYLPTQENAFSAFAERLKKLLP